MKPLDKLSLTTRIKLAQIPPSHEGCTFATYDRAQGDAEAFRLVKKHCTHMAENMAQGRGLLLEGPPGCGKTHLAVAALYEALEDGQVGVFITLAQLVRLLTKRFDYSRRQHDDGEDMADRLHGLGSAINFVQAKADLLVLDDVARERTSPSRFVDDELDYILRTRAMQKKTTIITTNISIEAWGKRYSAPLRSQVYQSCTIIRFEAKDYRIPEQERERIRLHEAREN